MNAPIDPKKTRAAPPATENAALETNNCGRKDSKKWQTTLGHLLRGPRHRFDGERWADHCLHSTVSDLRRNHGINCDREWREVATRFGSNCRVKVYWVSEESRHLAFRLLFVCKAKKRGGHE
jgi:hypothetical protein